MPDGVDTVLGSSPDDTERGGLSNEAIRDLLRAAVIVVGILFTAWAIQGLAATVAATVEADPTSSFGGPRRTWLELYRDDLVRNGVGLVIGLLLLFRGRVLADLLPGERPRADPSDEIDEGDERITFKFD